MQFSYVSLDGVTSPTSGLGGQGGLWDSSPTELGTWHSEFRSFLSHLGEFVVSPVTVFITSKCVRV